MNFLLIVVCVLSGYFLRAAKVVGKNAHTGINAWILYVAFPAIALEHLPYIKWSLELLLPLSMPFIIWIGAWIFLKIILWQDAHRRANVWRLAPRNGSSQYIVYWISAYPIVFWQ